MKRNKSNDYIAIAVTFIYKDYTFKGMIVEGDHSIKWYGSLETQVQLSDLLEKIELKEISNYIGDRTIEVLLLCYEDKFSTEGEYIKSVENSIVEFLMKIDDIMLSISSSGNFKLTPGSGVSLKKLPLLSKIFEDEDQLTLNELSVNVNSGVDYTGSMSLFVGGECYDYNFQSVETSRLLNNISGNSEIKWIDINKSFYILSLNRIGMAMKDTDIFLYLDIELQMSFLTISIMGLYVQTNIPKFTDWNVGIQGMNVSYISPELQVGGGLLYDEEQQLYSGNVILGIADLTVVASGLYQKDQGGKDYLFLLAELFYPLGGPPACYIEALSVGVGINYRMKLPDIDHIGEFPLLESLYKKEEINLECLKACLTEVSNESFITLGVQFLTFGVIQTDAVLSMTLKPTVTLDILGVCDFNFPNKDEKLIHATLCLKSTIDFHEGDMKMIGNLQNDSYLFAPACKLTGGFAAYMWFLGEHAHDFVFTIGGYHPQFPIAAYPHYPKVDPVGIQWIVDSHVAITGKGYCCLTSSGIMAGGQLSLLYQSGNLKAWLIAWADLWIQWKPWHYDIGIGVSIGASYRLKLGFIKHTFKVELGASLRLWGPKFQGSAKINWYIISFTIHFGGKPSIEQEVKWCDIEALLLKNSQNFLEEGELDDKQKNACTIQVTSGIISKEKEHLIIDNERMQIQVHTVVPVSQLHYNDMTIAEGKVYVLPYGEGVELNSELKLILYQLDGEKIVCDYQLIHEDVPEALWGNEQSKTPSANMVKNALVGCQLLSICKKSENFLPKSGAYLMKDILLSEHQLKKDMHVCDSGISDSNIYTGKSNADIYMDMKGKDVQREAVMKRFNLQPISIKKQEDGFHCQIQWKDVDTKVGANQ